MGKIVTVNPTVLCDTLDDPPPGGSDPFKLGNLASNIPNILVTADALSIDYGCPNPNCFPPTTTNTRQYHASFLVPAGTVPLDPNATNGTFYELDVAIALLNTCNSLPTTGITGSVPLEEVLFYSA